MSGLIDCPKVKGLVETAASCRTCDNYSLCFEIHLFLDRYFKRRGGGG